MKKLLAILLVAALLLSLCGCAFSSELADKSQEAVEAFLSALRDKDEAAAFAVMVPGVADEAQFHKTFEAMCRDIPCDEDYTLEVKTWDITNKIGTKDEWCTASYSLEWGGKSYTIDTTYSVENGQEGLYGFNITPVDGAQ